MLNAFWLPNHNFGDNLNHYILSRISKDILSFTDITSPIKKVVAIGSILGWCDQNTIAWGPGLGNFTDCVNPLVDIRAVRGPLSRKRAIECGLVVPEVYGDPALLLPLIYRPKLRKRHKLGIIPHYVDQALVNAWYRHESYDTLLIDILDTPENVIDSIASCDLIISSSMHGIIAAHAYGIPASWIKFSDKLGGDGMKFHDYFNSVGCECNGPIKCYEYMNVADLIAMSKEFFRMDVRVNVNPLLDSIPFESIF